MKRHLNTLYVTTQKSSLSVEGEGVVVSVGREVKLRVPMHMLEGIVCFGNVWVSPFLMGRCGDRGVGLAFLTEWGRFLARVQGPASGNVLLRRTQYREADGPGTAALLAKTFVAAKIANCRVVLQRFLRDHESHRRGSAVREAVVALGKSIGLLADAKGVDSVRGIEGDAAREYFAVFDYLKASSEPGFVFHGRSRRPPMDAVNAMLSFIYTILRHDVESALESVGLDPQVGFLHRDRPGRPSLALDMMEEFRPVVADRLVLSLLNRRQVKQRGFVVRENGAVMMRDETRKTVLTAYQERKQEEIRHPFLGHKTTVGMLVHLQALLLARYLRSDLDAYPAFFWK